MLGETMKRSQLVLMVLSAVVLLAVDAPAHEHWVDVISFYPDLGETLEVTVCSGHDFPKSSYLLEDRVVDGLRVWNASLAPRLLQSVAREKSRTAALPVEDDGVYVLKLTLKRPRAKEPNFEAKAIVVVNPLKDDPDRYALGEGLELVPHEALSAVRPGDTLSVSLVLESEALDGSLEVIPETGRSSFVRTHAERPGLIPIRKPGRYLVSAQVGGRGCSLVFDVLLQEVTEETEEGSR
jgi:hypothetical protein